MHVSSHPTLACVLRVREPKHTRLLLTCDCVLAGVAVQVSYAVMVCCSPCAVVAGSSRPLHQQVTQHWEGQEVAASAREVCVTQA